MYSLSFISAIFALGLLTVGCASTMTPRQFNERLPKVTSSKFYDRLPANEAISTGQCRLLVGGRKYTAPIGTTVSGDLKNGARGIDEWVRSDGGNAYAIANFEWIQVGDSGATQLAIYFDTMKCK